SERQAFFTSPEWSAVRRRVWARDRRSCQRCGREHRRGDPPYHVHHIGSWATHPGLRLELANLVLLCRPCHRWVHSSENTRGELLRADSSA
ncbi:MAG: HNH endonuclease, partial [Myxococcales bacterium]|nr:HNH endonuclease [Myxococcales bacterium]